MPGTEEGLTGQQPFCLLEASVACWVTSLASYVGSSCWELLAEEPRPLCSLHGGTEVMSEGSGVEQLEFLFQPRVVLTARTVG